MYSCQEEMLNTKELKDYSGENWITFKCPLSEEKYVIPVVQISDEIYEKACIKTCEKFCKWKGDVNLLLGLYRKLVTEYKGLKEHCDYLYDHPPIRSNY